MIRKLITLTCCLAAALTVSVMTPAEADAQAPMMRRATQFGHTVGRTTRQAFNRTNQVITNTTNRWMPPYNNYSYGYNNNYSYNNGSWNQNGNQNFAAPTTNDAAPVNGTPTSAIPGKTGNTIGTTPIQPAQNFQKRPAASEQAYRYTP